MRQSVSFQDITTLQLKISTLQQQVNQLTIENSSLQQQLTFLQKQLSLSKQSEEASQQKIKQYEQLLQEQNLQFQEALAKSSEIPKQLQEQLKVVLDEKDSLLNDFKEQTWIYKKTINNYESLTAQVQTVFSDKQQRKLKVTGLMEQLLSQQYKITNWKLNPQIQYEKQEFEVFEIKIGKHMNKILDKKLFFLANEGLQIDSLGKMQALVSLKPNVVADLQVGYIIEVQTTDDQSLKSKYLLRREPKQETLSQGYQKKQEAIQQSMNNMLCSALLERLRKRQPIYDEFKDYGIQRQFMLKATNLKLYYYCEMIEEGEFQKFNGGNIEPVINSELEDFINFFTFDSFQDIDEKLVVSHMQRFGCYFHDMIVSTFIGVFSQYDQGKQEVVYTIKNLEKALGFSSQTIK
ncbi:unnamed protein product (macronuclear) [Paramecium tetraurelia]|uniref:Alpha-type protein kinase domain-containing protein n=1 Tax=Paramecium tetraurelia TaxID=5888 RepID=A0DB43_PARTE|nr:uncharacterized protein GSPATT00015154001 [Paramecium tetraurelia]CAK80260.1 unnamed protein product [Paramecium tetraurelia]|eukprot:XP_001447657.1 hypothetical protein (macronuclear) [Paramecium tetraurelia strain d4-2]